jgi:hypothetical protein
MVDLSQDAQSAPSILTRKEQAEKRKEEFFKQLQEARSQENAPNTHLAPAPEVTEAEKTEVLSTVEEEDDEIPLDAKAIPKKRLDKEITKRKSLESALEQERNERNRDREELIKLRTEQELLNKAIAQMNAPKESAQTEIDPLDPDAHNLYMAKLAEMEQKYEQRTQSLTETQIMQQFANVVDRQAEEFKAKNNDFDDAYNYLLGIEAEKAMMMGYSENDAKEMAYGSIRPLAWKAYEQGKNVAELTYNMAKKYGYVAKNKAAKASAPNLDAIEKNAPKSHSALNDMQGVATNVAPEHAAYMNLEGFQRKLYSGRKINIDEFRKAIEKVSGSNQY